MFLVLAAGSDSAPLVVANWIYVGLLIVALLNLIVYLWHQVVAGRALRPNLQLCDVRKDLSGSPNKAPLHVVLMNIGGRPAKLLEASFQAGGKMHDAVRYTSDIVLPRDCVTIELKDTFLKYLQSAFAGQVGADRFVPLRYGFAEANGTRRQTRTERVPFYPPSPATQSSEAAYWVGPDGTKKPSGWR